MTPSEYNKKQLDQGRLTPEHITELAKCWQQSNDLKVDGLCGPVTIGTVDKHLSLPKTTAHDNSLLQSVWEEAYKDVGRGGNGKVNNEGPYLDRIRTTAGLPKRGKGAWCAVGISNWTVLVDKDFGHSVASRGARGLVNNFIKAGAVELEPNEVAVGDVVVALYARGNINSGLHHVRLVKRTNAGWEAIGANEAGDKVRFRRRGGAAVERRLIKMVGFPTF